MKTAQLQIRISPEQKALLRRRAALAGQSVSAYVLGRVAPSAAVRMESVLSEVWRTEGGSFSFADLSDLLTYLSPSEFSQATATGLPAGLSSRIQNQVAAMVEHAASKKGVEAPAWTANVLPLESPWFASDLLSLRAHLLRASPAAFRRRNLFIDSTVGDRV